MPRTTGPYQLTANDPVIASPGSSSGNFSAAAAVVVNLSPYELVIGTGMSASQQLVDPVTRDLVPLDPQAGQQVTLTPLAVGISPGGITQEVYVIFYGVGEQIPGSFPSPIPQPGSPANQVLAANSFGNTTLIIGDPPAGGRWWVTGAVGFPETSADGTRIEGNATSTVYFALQSSGQFIPSADRAVAPITIGEGLVLNDSAVFQNWNITLFGWLGG